MAFLGEYLVSFTGQGRIVIPKKIREGLGKEMSFTLSRGYDGCLSGYSQADWKKATEELLQESAISGRRVDLRRLIFSSALTIEIDRQGRAIVPNTLLEYALLKNAKEAVIIGVGNHFEIWEESKWKSYQKTIEESINREKES